MTVREAFLGQARACRALGSPLTAALCEVLAARLDPAQGALARRMLDWPGDPGSGGDSVPLRIAGGLHQLVLDGAAPALACAYAAGGVDWEVLAPVLREHEAALLDALDRPPQTNEVARCGALAPAAHFALGQLPAPLPLAIMEMGTSAGLNLGWPAYRVAPQGAPVAYGLSDGAVVLTPDWDGPAPEPQPIRVARAEGVDLYPVRDPEALLAYTWADQPVRMARLRAAAEAALRDPPQITQGDAGAWLVRQLAAPAQDGVLRLVQHSIAWQYFPPPTRAKASAALEAAGRAATARTPVAHLAMEGDGRGDGAALHLRLWDGTGATRHWLLGRADFHGRWVRWAPQQQAQVAP